jgi:basic membrane protein A
MKRLLALMVALLVAAGLFAGCAKKEEQQGQNTQQQQQAEQKKIKVGLSTDEGGLNDKSFNQAADEGIKKAVAEFGVEYSPVESTKKEDYQPNLEALVENGSDLVFAVGFQMEEAIKAISAKYPDKKFAIVDSVVPNPNVVSLVFKEEEGSFLMGVIAGKMTKTGKVGFIGGKDFALINKFEAGFVAGVKAVNPKAAEDLINRKNVKYADSFSDTNKGYELAKSLYNSGVDVIYHAAGGVGEGLFQATKEFRDKGKMVWAIGVDMDQAVTLPKYADVILSSMMKRVDTATYTAVKDVVNNNFQGGKTIVLGIKEDGVGYAPTTKNNTPADVLALVDKYRDAIKAGKFTVPDKPADVKNFTAPEIK